MSKSLPARPNLEHLKKEAKDLLDAFNRGDAAALPVIRHLTYLNAIPDAELLTPGRAKVGLQNVQFALAVEYGFKDWNQLLAKAGGTHPAPYTDVEQVADLANWPVQVILRDLEDADFAAIAGNGSDGLRRRLFDNVTDRYRARLEASPAFTARDAAAISSARQALLRVANFMLGQGEIPGPDDIGAANAGTHEDRETWNRRARERFVAEAGPVPVSGRTNEDLVPVFVALGKMARAEGLLALDAVAETQVDEPLVRDGVRELADGELVEKLRGNRTAAGADLLSRLDRRQELVIAGVTRLGAAYTPDAMQATLEALPGGAEAGELVAFFVAMAGRAAAGGLIAIEDEPPRVADDLLRLGLQPLVDGTDTEMVREIMEARARVLRGRLERRIEMTAASIEWIATGTNPRLIEMRCRAML